MTRLQNITAIKTGIAVLIACAFSFIDTLSDTFPQAIWICVTVLVVFETYVGAVLKKGAMRVTGTVVGGLLALGFMVLMEWLFDRNSYFKGFMWCSVAVVAGVCQYIRQHKLYKSYQYTFLILAMTYSMVGVSPSNTVGFERMLMILFGSLIVGFVGLVVFPQYADVTLHELYVRSLDKTIAAVDMIDTLLDYSNKLEMNPAGFDLLTDHELTLFGALAIRANHMSSTNLRKLEETDVTNAINAFSSNSVEQLEMGVLHIMTPNVKKDEIFGPESPFRNSTAAIDVDPPTPGPPSATPAPMGSAVYEFDEAVDAPAIALSEISVNLRDASPGLLDARSYEFYRRKGRLLRYTGSKQHQTFILWFRRWVMMLMNIQSVVESVNRNALLTAVIERRKRLLSHPHPKQLHAVLGSTMGGSARPDTQLAPLPETAQTPVSYSPCPFDRVSVEALQSVRGVLVALKNYFLYKNELDHVGLKKTLVVTLWQLQHEREFIGLSPSHGLFPSHSPASFSHPPSGVSNWEQPQDSLPHRPGPVFPSQVELQEPPPEDSSTAAKSSSESEESGQSAPAETKWAAQDSDSEEEGEQHPPSPIPSSVCTRPTPRHRGHPAPSPPACFPSSSTACQSSERIAIHFLLESLVRRTGILIETAFRIPRHPPS
eukprot:GCRY01005650.1.p1 GENE.GCRY01005650.1~~GCRY01005650.1.p1  ORF type:complete len:657 (-),score=171.86 GCRY01005650.1:205-2175(-)